jgi:hypothetical protein
VPRVPGPEYDLNQVCALIDAEPAAYFISGRALVDAQRFFGFFENDILRTLKKLRPKHYAKTTSHDRLPNINIDHYIIKLKEFKIYTHFHIENNELAIISFKETT